MGHVDDINVLDAKYRLRNNTLNNGTQVQSKSAVKVNPVVENFIALIFQRCGTGPFQRDSINIVRQILCKSNNDFFRMVPDSHKANSNGHITHAIKDSVSSPTSHLDGRAQIRRTNQLAWVELQGQFARSNIASLPFDQNVAHIGTNCDQRWGCQQ